CQCNGHAGECDRQTEDESDVCHCEHNTDGDNCERCKEGFYRRDVTDICQSCNCS
ncbi:hypothetical protein CAPTEDRAFT_28785, partial [Capitella teleta]